MSASLQPKSNSQEYEIVLSINLQIPISIKPEVTMLPPIYSSNSNNQAVLNEDSKNLMKYITANLGNLQENDLVRKIVAEVVIPQDCESENTNIKQIVNLTNRESIQRIDEKQQRFKGKTIMGRVVDSLNDSLAFTANVTSTMMLFGKVANYSWE
jgi:hypothetical protein